MQKYRDDIEIGGDCFRISQLGGMRGVKLVARMMRLFGPALTKALGESAATVTMQSLASLNVAALAPAVSMLCEALTESEMEGLVRELLSTAQIKQEGKWVELFPAQFELTMGGRFYDVLKLCIVATEVHLGNFFAALRADAARWMPAKVPPLPGSST